MQDYTYKLKFIERFLIRDGKVSYSQSGEDMLVDFIFRTVKINSPSYLDIGAYHPIRLSNTYRFYKRGCQGVCVEPDPDLYKQLKRKRPRDTCINVGIGTTQKKAANFYVMTSRTLNTFSREEAERYQGFGTQRIVKTIQVPLIPINDIVKQYFDPYPHFISLDVEGVESDIVKSFDFSSYRPLVFCVETITYAEDNSGQKLSCILDYMHENGYMTFADTYINTIFVEKDKWQNR
jgi:FkbM family methyltransferase